MMEKKKHIRRFGFGFLPIWILLMPLHLSAQENTCTESVNQSIYTTKAEEPIQSSTKPMISGKRLEYSVGLLMQDREEESQRLKDVVMVMDYNADIPVFIVFNKRGKPYCSAHGPLLDFPDHYSYRALTKDHQIITAGILPSEPIRPGQAMRRLVNDNINKEAIDDVKTDNIVMECYKTKNWMGDTYSIRINVSPDELDNYRNDIISMIQKGYDQLTTVEEVPEEAEEDESEEDFSHDGRTPLFAMESGGAKDLNTSSGSAKAGSPEPVLRREEAPAPIKKNEEKDVEEDPAEEDEDLAAAAEEEEEIVKEQPDSGEPTGVEDSIDEIMEDELTVEETVDEQAVEASENEEQEVAKEPANLGARNVPKLEDEITDEEMLEIQEQAEMKLKELESVFVKLTNRKLNSGQKERVRTSAVDELFINERAHVAVSSLNSEELTYYPIPDYLYRLETLIAGAYQEVEIAFSEIHKVTNFKPNPDGTWSATVTFSQQFKGYKDLDGRQPTYSDITQKNVTVKIRRVELFTGDSTPDVYWEVLLADIGVNQTNPF
ncbi:MAG: hypothetical protein LC670_10365 [Flavobacteriales bacterium]|nr:hypothetical protein [Flavobacteriales bacterium]